jgi:hypothetical protein
MAVGDSPGDERTGRVHGHLDERGRDHRVHVLQRCGSNQYLVAQYECSTKGLALAELDLYRSDIRHPVLASVREHHLTHEWLPRRPVVGTAKPRDLRRALRFT